MSSAILYLAIVAIWACVLIPRWLRRDSARGAAVPEPVATPEPATAPAPAPPVETEVDADQPAEPAGDDLPAEEPVRPAAPSYEPARPAGSRRRMLAARRRLLLMLIGLEVAAVALGITGLAALWVVIPPTVMLGGYLLLLREAASADAERSCSMTRRPVAVSGPKAAGLTKVVSNRVVTAVRSDGRWAITALPVAESSMAASMPPCTVP